MFTLCLSEQDSVGGSNGVCVMLCCAAHSEEVWLQVKCTDFRWIRTTSFLVVLNFISVDFFVKISKSLPNKRYYALTLVEVFRCFPETPCIDKDNLPQTVTNSSCPVYNLSQHVHTDYRPSCCDESISNKHQCNWSQHVPSVLYQQYYNQLYKHPSPIPLQLANSSE